LPPSTPAKISCETGRKGKREYLNDSQTQGLVKDLNLYFQSKVEIPRTRMGGKQEIETLISEEALLFAMFLRSERQSWKPRIAELSDQPTRTLKRKRVEFVVY